MNSSVEYLEFQNESLDSYNYDNKMVADIIQDKMEEVKFNGISVCSQIKLFLISNLTCLKGSVAFSEATGDRMAWTKIEQLVNTK